MTLRDKIAKEVDKSFFSSERVDTTVDAILSEVEKEVEKRERFITKLYLIFSPSYGGKDDP
jgi:hypothetical protein